MKIFNKLKFEKVMKKELNDYNLVAISEEEMATIEGGKCESAALYGFGSASFGKKKTDEFVIRRNSDGWWYRVY